MPKFLYRYRVRLSVPRLGNFQRWVTEPNPTEAVRAAKAILRDELHAKRVRLEAIDNCGVASEQVHPQTNLFEPEEMQLKKGA